MGAGTALARVEAAALRARSVQDFLSVVDAIRLLDEGQADELLRLIRTLRSTTPNLAAVLREAMLTAARQAAGVAVAMVDDLGIRPPTVTPSQAAAAARADADRASRAMQARILGQLRQAAALAASGAPLDVVTAPLGAASTSLRATLTTSIHSTGNATVARLSDLARLPTVWVAETDACVDCLAYSGQVADVGDGFPEGLSFVAVPRVRPTGASLVAPPLHPNCRCEVEPLGEPEYAEALRREAERSILRGFSLESESMATRVEAAQRLLERGVDAPASVIAYSQRWVRAGRFPSRA